MNNIFDIKRFGFTVRKDFLENLKQYALLFATMLGIMAIFAIYKTWSACDLYVNNNIQYQYMNLNSSLLIFFSVTFYIGGLLFASTFMKPMNNKLKRISYLINPSSNLEKFFSRWVIVTVGYILAFFAAMWITDALRVAIVSVGFPDLNIRFIDLTKLVYFGDSYGSDEFLFHKNYFSNLVLSYFFFQSLFLLGSTFWEKAAFVKTFIALLVIVIVYIILCRWAILFSYEDGMSGFGKVLNSFISDNIEIESSAPIVLSRILASLFILSNWTLAFFRLRESEIIKRL